MNEPDSARIKMAAVVARIANTGVLKRELTRAKAGGSWPWSDIENSKRVAGVIEAPNTPAQAMTAASETAFAPHGPTNDVAASANGRSEFARFGSVPTQTTCVIVYRIRTQPTDTRIANGTECCGSRTSPANTEVASKPKKANVARKMALDKL